LEDVDNNIENPVYPTTIERNFNGMPRSNYRVILFGDSCNKNNRNLEIENLIEINKEVINEARNRDM